MKKTLKIEFEGVDGSGKTTALKYFIQKANDMGLSVKETREVGNPNVPICVKLREIVLDPNSKLSGKAMEFIFSAMRYENDKWFKELVSSKDSPAFVVSDRGYLSHLAYTDHNVSEEFAQKLYGQVVGPDTMLPDVVFYFSVNTETALKRRIRRGEDMDVIEMKGVKFQEKVRHSFDKYLSAYSDRIKVVEIDANQDIESVHSQIDGALATLKSQYSL